METDAAPARTRRRKEPLTRGEKWLLGVSLALAALFATYAIWRYTLDINPVVTIPAPPPMPSPNALAYYERAYALRVYSIKAGEGTSKQDKSIIDIADCIDNGKIVKPRNGKPPLTLAEMQELIKRNTPAITMARKGFPYEYQDKRLQSFDQSRLDHPCWEIYPLFIAEGEYKSVKGDWDEGLQSFIDCIEIGIDSAHGGGTTMGAISNGIRRKAYQDIWPMVEHASGNSAKLNAQRLEMLAAQRVSYSDILRAEKAEVQASLMHVFRHPDWQRELWREWGWSSPQPDMSAIRLFATGKRTVMTNYTRYIDALIAISDKPYPICMELPPTPTDPISAFICPPSIFSYLRTDVQHHLITVSLALRAYRAEHGAYPASLQALVPGYLKAIPADPFTVNGTLLYKRTGNRYLLYSVGPDGIDNGGTPSADGVKYPGISSTHLDSTGDIVAGVNIR